MLCRGLVCLHPVRDCPHRKRYTKQGLLGFIHFLGFTHGVFIPFATARTENGNFRRTSDLTCVCVRRTSDLTCVCVFLGFTHCVSIPFATARTENGNFRRTSDLTCVCVRHTSDLTCVKFPAWFHSNFQRGFTQISSVDPEQFPAWTQRGS